MTDLHTGSCLCGAVSYSFEGDPKTVAICHCIDCQKSTGSPFATLMLVSKKKITQDGEMVTYAVTGESGGTNTRASCAKCGSLIFEESSGMPGSKLISVGTLDDFSWVKPQFHCWVSSKQPWLELNDDLPKFNKGPEF